jgi:hypothetical protein
MMVGSPSDSVGRRLALRAATNPTLPAFPPSRLPVLFIVICSFGLAVAGCDVVTNVGPQTCDFDEDENPPVTYRGGTVESGVYMSSPWDQGLVYFPGGMQVRLEHGLGRVPRAWAAYVSFDPEGTAGDGSMAPAAGNQVELMTMDDVALTVRNSTCADYYLLITAQVEASPTPSDG